MKTTLSREEINAIQSNLIAIGLVTNVYVIESGRTELSVNKNGMRLYATLLSLLQKNKIFNGPILTDSYIKTHTLCSFENLLLKQNFIDFTPLDSNKCVLTQRGMEHIIIMFALKQKGHTRIGLKINKFIRFGKV